MSAVTISALYLPLLISGFALIVSIVSVFILKAYVKRRTSREWLLEEGTLTEIRDEVNTLLKSIDETADRDITLITEREKSLRILLGEVDKRLRVYIREMDKRPEAEGTYAALLSASASKDAGSGNNAGTVSNENAAVSKTASEGTYVDLGKLRYRMKKQDASETPIAEIKAEPESIPINPKPSPTPESKPEKPFNTLSVSDQVNSLMKEGFTVQAIASRLGLSIAEVEFTATLLERRQEKENQA